MPGIPQKKTVGVERNYAYLRLRKFPARTSRTRSTNGEDCSSILYSTLRRSTASGFCAKFYAKERD